MNTPTTLETVRTLAAATLLPYFPESTVTEETETAGWHFLYGYPQVTISWAGHYPAAFDLRFDLMHTIAARLQAAGLSANLIENVSGDLCVAVYEG